MLVGLFCSVTAFWWAGVCGAKIQHSAFISLLYSTLAIAMYRISNEVCVCGGGGCAGRIYCIMT